MKVSGFTFIRNGSMLDGAAVGDARIEVPAFDYHHFFGSLEWRASGPDRYRRGPRM